MILSLAMLLDALCGEPRWLWQHLPHPAVLMGRAVAAADRRLNGGTHRRAKGIVALLALNAAALAVGLVLVALPGRVADILALAILLAQRSLSDHVHAVAEALRHSSDAGRRAVAMIVGRETAQMQQADVARAAIESGAENLSDGVIAPIFWFALAGLPGVLIYKMTNTADSMIGYRTPRHADFGWAAARCDDVLNWLPARLTAAMILLITWRPEAARHVLADAPRHRSPNAGWPEAATAHALDFALSGPRFYDGKLHDEPFINPAGVRELRPLHIARATGLLWRVWVLMLALVVLAQICALPLPVVF